MKRYTLLSAYSFAFIFLLVSCKNEDNAKEADKTETKAPKFKEENVEYKIDTLNMKSYVVYDENIQGKRPAVLVVHEWWGLNDYAKSRARQLAELGYIAMAVDMYGNGRMGDDPGAAQNLAMPFYYHPDMAKKHFDMALEELKKNPNVDQTKIAAMGYCFGGAVVIGVARLGEDLKGVVSFHGNLNVVPPVKDLLKAEVLVCHGAADSFVLKPEVDQFVKQMDSIGAKYSFKTYAGATHAFTNPEATAKGEKFKMPIAYNAAADTASWNDMKDFFIRIFN
jgi:dienelactone hydrolase